MIRHFQKGALALLVVVIAACPIAPHAIVGTWSGEIGSNTYTFSFAESGSFDFTERGMDWENTISGTYEVSGKVSGEVLMYSEDYGDAALIAGYEIEGDRLILNFDYQALLLYRQ